MRPAASLGRLVVEGVEAVLVAALMALFARAFVVQAFKIPSGSMAPTLFAGDHILVNKFIYGPAATAWERRLLPLRPPHRGDVVVFRYPPDPSRDFIKRCVAVAGDRLRLDDKRLLVNGKLVDDAPYAVHLDPRVYPGALTLDEPYRRRDNAAPSTVPPRHLFALGDNRDYSLDSRFWGPVPLRYLKGRALLVYWSSAGEPSDAGETPTQEGHRFLSVVR